MNSNLRKLLGERIEKIKNAGDPKYQNGHNDDDMGGFVTNPKIKRRTPANYYDSGERGGCNNCSKNELIFKMDSDNDEDEYMIEHVKKGGDHVNSRSFNYQHEEHEEHDEEGGKVKNPKRVASGKKAAKNNDFIKLAKKVMKEYDVSYKEALELLAKARKK